jgi:hypothetical protein
MPIASSNGQSHKLDGGRYPSNEPEIKVTGTKSIRTLIRLANSRNDGVSNT